MNETSNAVISVLSGAPLHGKTATALALQRVADCIVVDVDAIRKRDFPNTSGTLLEADEELRVMVASYVTLIAEAEMHAGAGRHVVIPATFSRAEFKRPLLDLLRRRRDVRTRIFKLTVASLAEIEKRLESRAKEGSLSTIKTLEKYQWALTLPTPWPDDVPIIEIDTSGGPDAAAHRVLNNL